MDITNNGASLLSQLCISCINTDVFYFKMEDIVELGPYICKKCLIIISRVFRTSSLNLTILYLILIFIIRPGHSWLLQPQPNSRTIIDRNSKEFWRFESLTNVSERFRIILISHDYAIIGARNRVYNVSLSSLEENQRYRISWKSTLNDQRLCLQKKKTIEECQNYIRVVFQKEDGSLLICGTNSFKPLCRDYVQRGDSFVKVTQLSGIGRCPLNPNHNNTFIYTDGQFYAGTVVDFIGQNFLIYSDKNLVTQQKDSRLLNHPNFVKSFSYEDKIYFFFREIAVENTNCGKTVFSRVARVCKKDRGGSVLLSDSFTSFFKSRLNCSIPGDFPFYFDEIDAVSDIGQGNFMSTYDSGNRSDMVYATFNTPVNSIGGSAICAFRMVDIIKAFRGQFKGQHLPHHNWLAVPKSKTPIPHPEECTEHSDRLSPNTLDFIKSHPLMDEAVSAFGAGPVFVQTGINYRFTAVAIDWQVYASNNRFYDVIFIGTDNGHVLKVINIGHDARIQYNLIEDIVIFNDGDAVTSLHINRRTGAQRLIVSSHNHVISIPLHRCQERTTCSSCVALQDPYCSWLPSERRCFNTDRGIQAIQNRGRHSLCKDEEPIKGQRVLETSSSPICPPCFCHNKLKSNYKYNDKTKLINVETSKSQFNKLKIKDPEEIIESADFSVTILAVSVAVSALLSMVIGILIGYRISICRRRQNHQQAIKKCDLHKNISGSNNQFLVFDAQPKKMNVSLKNTNSHPVTDIESKHSNKFYL